MPPVRTVSPPRKRPVQRAAQTDDDTSDSNCSCSSCDNYRKRKDKLRPAMRCWLQSNRDDSGDEAYKNGWLTERYGKYGLIDPADRNAKTAEYHSWLLEVRNVAWENLTPYEDRQLWKDFVDRYNTATMPSKKFYDLSKAPGGVRLESKADVLGRGILVIDEDERKELSRRARQYERDREIQEAFERIKDDESFAQAIQNQRELRTKMSLMFKTGEMEQARELQSQLVKQRKGAAGGGGGEEDPGFETDSQDA